MQRTCVITSSEHYAHCVCRATCAVYACGHGTALLCLVYLPVVSCAGGKYGVHT